MSTIIEARGEARSIAHVEVVVQGSVRKYQYKSCEDLYVQGRTHGTVWVHFLSLARVDWLNL